MLQVAEYLIKNTLYNVGRGEHNRIYSGRNVISGRKGKV